MAKSSKTIRSQANKPTMAGKPCNMGGKGKSGRK